MCGIAGIINYQDFNLEVLKKSLVHRGPDDQIIFTESNLALIHTRLAIQDIVHGKQPFHHSDFSIIFNGEIYNHKELRLKLPEFTFITTSDTETLLYLYIKYKEAMFEMLDGMFAFCIYDRNKNCILLARDRVGKKPLYYAQVNNSFIFASELNAMRSIASFKIDENAINCYLRTGFIFKPYTPYKNIKEMEPASYLTIDLHSLNMASKEYYSILNNYLEPHRISLKDALVGTEEKLKQSVKDRMLSSDVNVGVFLSGGIDSNLVVALASQVSSRIKTFTVKFDGLYDESHLARLTANKYQTDHTELPININLDNDIECILARYGEPFMDSSAIPSFYIAREAKKHVGVVLNGDGADELFGGYRRYVPIATNLIHLMRFILPLKSLFPLPHNKQSLYTYFYRLLSMSNKQNLDFYLSATSDIYEDTVKFKDNEILKNMSTFIESILTNHKLTELSKMLYLDYSILLFSDLLVKMDIATMAHSLEARSPFLSKYILNFVPRLPDSYKVNKLVTKYILRQLAKKYLPKELIMQPKRGFEIPLKTWVNNNLKEKIFDSLRRGCYSESFIDRDIIDKILERKENISEEKRAKMLWSLFCLEVWYKNETQQCIGITI